jgi:hypothetical protein
MEQTKTSISTYSGKFFDILKPEEYEYDIEEIAHALSNICRYTGHTNKFYSVAEHSVLVSRLVEPRYALAGLLHDAGEAYLGDVSSPLKALLPAYKEIEESVEGAISRYFGFEFPLPPEIKEADKKMYWQERQGIADNGVRDRLWNQDRRAARKVSATGLAPHMAKRMFLSEYRKIVGETQDKGQTRPESKAA